MSKQNLMTLKQVSATLELSEVWVRRQFSKNVGILGENARKKNGVWVIPSEAVEAKRIELAEKHDKYEKRKSGELPKYYNVYTPEKVKSPKVVKALLSDYTDDQELIEKMNEVLDRMHEDQNEKWIARKSDDNS